MSAPSGLLAGTRDGLPGGQRQAEAVAVRLRRSGIALGWGAPVEVAGLEQLYELARRRGHSSVEVMRADPTLLHEMQIGSWFDVRWHATFVRRAAATVARAMSPFPPISGAGARLWQLGMDAAFWAGVRSAATGQEWRRLTQSSCTVLDHHRVAGDDKPGQERSISARPVRTSAACASPARVHGAVFDQLLDFLADPNAVLAPRSYVVTADDGYVDCLLELRKHIVHRPQLFVPTAAVGRRAWWLDGEPVAGWEETAGLRGGRRRRRLARSHARAADRPFPDALEDELTGSRTDLVRISR